VSIFPHKGWLVAGCLALGAASTPEAWSQAAGAQPSLDQMFKQGAEAFNSGNYDRTITLFEGILKQARPSPVLEPIYYTIATAKLLKGDNDGAIESFRNYMRLYPNGAQLNDARAGLTKALIAAKRMPEALAAINALRDLRSRSGSQGIDNYAAVLDLTLSIADSLLVERKTAEALDLIQTALMRDDIIDRQRQRIGQLDRLLKQAQATSASASADSSLAANRDALASRLNDARAALKVVEDNPNFDIPRLLRQGQCYMELNQPWEAMVVYNEILTRFPTAPDRSYALRGLIFARQAVNRLADAQALCQRFLTEFPTSPFLPEIAAVGGQISTQLEDNAKAASFFGSAIENSKGDMLERVIIQLGGARFSLGDWAGAREMFDRYTTNYPSGQWVDSAAYRSAISWFLDVSDADRYGKAEKALKAFIEKNPNSTYLSDAYYRLAVCKFAFQEYKQAVAACDEWEKRFPSDVLIAEVLSLKGDVQKTMGDTDAALETYLRASTAAITDEVLSYTLAEAGRILEQKRDWKRLASVFTAQIDRQPDSKLVLGWYFWVARANARDGHPDEAWNFLADRVGQQMTNAANEDVEKIIELMAQIRSRERKSADDAAPAPADQLSVRLKLSGEATPLVRARLRYYESSVLGMTRKPAEAEKILLSIGRETPAEQLSAPLLAVSGEALYKNGDKEQASAFFNTLLERYPSSDYRDFAYVGLGDLALDRKESEIALAFYDDAIKKAGAPHRQREATVGQARSKLALGKLDEAEKLFEMIAGAKQWRGEATALSLYYLGEIAVKKGDLPKGIVFFQRVFVSQVRYPAWVAKAYLASGQAFEALGKKPEAANTYREMLRTGTLANYPEFTTAREHLKQIDPSS
jgi:outer membrane protein assembly factor BamD (BamD/ComL family)